VFSSVLLALMLLVVAPLAAYLPLAVMAALLFVVAWGLIDFAGMRRIARTSRGDIVALAVTFLAMLTIQLEFAILVGVLASLLAYLNRTTHPRRTRERRSAASLRRKIRPRSVRSSISCATTVTRSTCAT
jgi:SulP family sulfate permease